MTVLIAILLLILAVTSLGVVLTREPRRQAIAMGANGLVLGLLFLAFQAPDAAYSEIVIGGLILPLLFMVALSTLRTTGKKK
ncbi:protein of unknown function [Faunimonas pinastri]|uniref:MrpA C-terminal/MbhD domain-containing protein n=1 Tax=Faunimonas pinastri TaxID=1855383 RepID=A0A1H9LGT2_9HYPH|nr:DUF4040 domain-containing protein [Faunimonas pinastri]SER10325.1 protein of unknown function [Faunimonas pinastri]